MPDNIPMVIDENRGIKFMYIVILSIVIFIIVLFFSLTNKGLRLMERWSNYHMVLIDLILLLSFITSLYLAFTR